MTRVLYLHGFASGPSSSKAQYFRRRLESAGAVVEVPDLAAGDFEHLTITRQLAIVDRAARNETVTLIGSSMGGYLAALYAARHSEVDRLCLLAPAFQFAARWHERLGPEQIEAWRLAGSVDVYHYGDRRMHPIGFELLRDSEAYEPFPDFRQPALIFHGIHDDVVPATYSEQFAADHPNVRLEVLDAGHDLLNVLDYMAEQIVPFLVGQALPPAR